MRTFWALTVVPKAQQTGDGGSRFHKQSTAVENEAKPKMVKPLYETEADVTRAIANGTKQTDPNYPNRDPYQVARDWQKELKRLAPKKFKPSAKTANRNGKYNHTLSFGH